MEAPKLELKAIKFPKDADNGLRLLRARTGLSANLLCRMAFCMSLEEQGDPSKKQYSEDGLRTPIDRRTLLGDLDPVFVALLRQRLSMDNINPGVQLDEHFKAHIYRGIGLLSGRLKHISDLADCLPRSKAR